MYNLEKCSQNNGLIIIFLALADLFLFDLVFGDEETLVINVDYSAYYGDSDIESDIEEDVEAGNILVLFFLGGQDIDEPYTDLASALTIVQILDYVDFSLDDDEAEILL